MSPKKKKEEVVKVLDYVKKEDRDDSSVSQWYAGDPSKVYPAMCKWCHEAVEKSVGDFPEAERIMYARAKALADRNPDAFLEAAENKAGPDRAEALEVARLWFTRKLREEVGEPIGMHWLNPEGANDDWKL